MFRSSRTEPTPLDGRDSVLADLDGVVYTGADAIPFAVESLNRAAETLRVGYITNNASRTDASVAGHLSELGLSVRPEDVVTSPQAAVVLLADLVPAGSTILVVGAEGLTSEVERAGFTVTRSAEDSPAAVIQGFAPTVGWEQLAEASFALHTGIPWVATNTDWTIPVARGIAPGNGTLVSAVHTAVGRLPVVAGKPERAIFDAATARFGSANPLFLGDRLDTDIAGANGADMESAHVLTGIDRAKQLLAAEPKLRPTYILSDLRELHLPYPATTVSRNGVHAVRGAKVRLDGDSVVIVDAGDDATDLLRAACSVIWSSGRAIYGLDVPESLYS
ncbi:MULTISPECIES: HAD-IIA family hydrolase [unclassified Rathayibacter]|uniref:HAD-IIA family hydrolase n=1 Tax=unclassified Rathayibacter TaxID=2609250 RepID=UPI000CE72486|nr:MULTISPECIES: HAD-IIA family hydrolase [unclassified Rathayibacter]PPG48642.1 haloacid dehalogenase [Rathayibacter sp. AY2B3]PPI20560.1 haloacid dehalogenase [Rathayibacter sp. AY1B6]PPI24053.1 haloacid dehalogenase [Rathayibacter sp. AY1B5]PPI35291.1 haloacid dehalogenase [Rathayibacter sp. AY1B1]